MAYIEASGGKEEQTKTVTAITSALNVLPDSGKVLSKVTVNPQNHSEMFNVFSYIWDNASTLPYDFAHSSAVVYNNEIHILGGNYYLINHYKWNGSSWTEVSTLLPHSFYNGSAVVYNNEIHILGGSSTGKTKHYKWNGSSWTSVSTLPYDFDYGSAVVYNNEIHILGGGNTNDRNKHYKWDGSSWTSVSTLPYSLYTGSAVVYNNEIHILGGNNNLTKHYKWNGSSWTQASTLPYNFYYGSAVVYNNEIHILGSSSNKTKHCKWNGSSWTQASTLPYNFDYGSAVVYNNNIHILGGSGNTTKHYKIFSKSVNDDMGSNHSYRYVDVDTKPIKTLLYNNPNPTAAQAAGTITLTGPANIYDWLLIKFADWIPGQGTQERYSLWPDPTIYKEPSSDAHFSFIAVGGYRGSSYGHARRLYFGKSDTNWTTMYMTNGQQMNRAGTSNNGCIIQKIYGVNGLSTDWLT